MTGFVSNGPAFGAGQTRASADLGDLVSSTIFGSVAAIEAASPAASADASAFALLNERGVDPSTDGPPVACVPVSDVWTPQPTIDIDLTGPDAGRCAGDAGFDGFRIGWRWLSSGSAWVPQYPYANGAVFSGALVGSEDGTARLAAGFTDTTAGGGAIATDGTRIAFTTAAGSDKAYLEHTPTTGKGLCVTGYIRQTRKAGTVNIATLVQMYDGTRGVGIGADNTGYIVLANGAMSAEIGTRSKNVLITSERFFELRMDTTNGSRLLIDGEFISRAAYASGDAVAATRVLIGNWSSIYETDITIRNVTVSTYDAP